MVTRKPPAPVEPPKKASKRYASGENTRILSDWVMADADADELIVQDAGRTRARARSLRRDNPYFRRFLAELAANVIGSDGIKLKMQARRPNKGRYANSPDNHTNKIIEDAWHDFGHAKNWDASRQMSRIEWSRLALQTVATAGELPIRLLRGFAKNDFRFAVQGFEPDHLPHNHNRDPVNGNPRIRGGIEMDAYGEPTAFHILKNHPGRGAHFHDDFSETIRVQSESYRKMSGERLSDSMLLAFVRDEFGQSRGMSWATTALRMLRQLSMFEESALVASRIAASSMFFIEPSELTAQYGEEEEEEAPDGSTYMDAQPGSGHKLLPGEKLSSWSPSQPTNTYESFRKGILRGISAGLLSNYSVIAADYESANYSSMRAAALSEREMWKMIQQWWICSVEEPVFRAWLEMAMISGQVPIAAEDFDRVCCASFQGRRWAWVDPMKDVQAAREEVTLGTNSLQAIARERGKDLRDIAEEMREDAAVAEGTDGEQPLGFSESFLPEKEKEPTMAQKEKEVLS